MSQGASYGDYARAYMGVTRSKNIVPVAALRKEEVPIRQGQAEPAKQEKVQKQVHQIGDIMRKVNGFAFLTCLCGLKLKVPPNFKADTIQCPRCSRKLPLHAPQNPKPEPETQHPRRSQRGHVFFRCGEDSASRRHCK
jgi:heat shock protein HtpX